MTELRAIIKNSDRYKDFTLLDEPIVFRDLFPGEDFDCVQVHSTQTFDLPNGGKDIIGFAGVFKYIGGIVSSLDRDSYSDTFQVIGYERFDNEAYGVKNGIEVLVGKGW